MAQREIELGRLTATHVIAPAYIQRAVFIAVLSFMFFLGMIFAAYIRPHILYIFLATAFLIVYLITMFSFVMQRKANVEIYDNGFRYRKNIVLWSEIADVSEKGVVTYGRNKTLTIPSTLNNSPQVIAEIKTKASI